MSATATVDLSVIRHNVGVLAAHVAPAAVCAVVKADGYGHGAVPVAEAALGAGATWLAVATPAEAAELATRVAERTPLLLLAEPAPVDLESHWDDLPEGLRVTIASPGGLALIDRLAARRSAPVPAHLKIDTGMHRVGVMPSDAATLARAITATNSLRLEAVWTHFAVADLPDDRFTDIQIRRFDAARAELETIGTGAELVHLCNSAGAIAHPSARRDLVRVGIAIYGIAPSVALEGRVDLRPALRLTAPVTAVRTVEPGESVSYGRQWFAEGRTRLATVAIGYADGVRRRSASAGVEVLVRGRRVPIVGTVTMDQLMIAVDDDVDVGDEVVLIGTDGDEEITANEIGGRLDTIGYEVITAIGARVRRVHTG